MWQFRPLFRSGFFFITALLTLGLLAGCRPPPLQEQQAYVFGTQVDVVVASDQPADAGRAIAAVLREFDRLHRTYHAWQPSALSALNDDLAAGRPHGASSELTAFVQSARELAKRGDYLFDPGIGGIVRLWGFHSETFRAVPPADEEIERWRQAHPSIADLRLGEDGTLRSTSRWVALDFGGYLKGVALDRAAATLRAQGIRQALINIGGNVMALGDKGGRPWRVAIRHPRQSGPLATLTLSDGEALGTSGDYQRYFEDRGQRYCHLIDPRTARPVAHTQAVSVLIPPGPDAGMLSDVTSKPLFIAGAPEWSRLARQLGVTQALRVDVTGRIEVTAALASRLTWVGEAPDLTIIP